MLFRWIERLIVPLFMITAALGLVYWYWTTTPSYAVQQVVNSLYHHDVDTFTRYVDLDTMGERALDEIIHGPAKDSGLFGNFDSFIGMGIVSLFKTEIVEMFKAEVCKAVKGDSLVPLPANQPPQAQAIPVSAPPAQLPGAGSALANPQVPAIPSSGSTSLVGSPKPGKIAKLKAELEEYGLSKKGFKGIDYFKEENGMNFIGLKFHSPKYDTDFIIEFKLEDAGGYWRVTELSNLSALVEKYMELRDKSKAEAEKPAAAIEAAPASAGAGTAP